MKYKEKLFAYLSGKAFGVPRDRLGWAGYMAAHELFVQTSQGERRAVVEAMLEIVAGALDSTDEEMWLVAADLIHLAYSLDLRDERLDHLVRKLRAKRAPTEQCAEAISYASSTYLHLPQNSESSNLERWGYDDGRNGSEPSEDLRPK